MEYLEALKALHEKRMALAKAKEALDEIEREDRYAVAYANYQKANAETQTADGAVRELARQRYEETHEKTLVGAKIRIAAAFSYDATKAVEWARANAPAAIVESVNPKVFDALLDSLEVLPEFVEVVTKVTPAIDRDLTDALKDA
jgi:hypothetical protein